jgi:hypothetical protein
MNISRVIRKWRRRGALVTLVAAALTVTVAASASELIHGQTAFQATLRATVENANSEPLINPASVSQTSLAKAAAEKNGPGTRREKLARGVTFSKVQRPPDLPNVNETGMISGGCLIDYGNPGAQCVPARGRGGGALTCADVVSIFPDGVRVTGRDRFGLDSNGDKTACGRGDRGVPPRRATRSDR